MRRPITRRRQVAPTEMGWMWLNGLVRSLRKRPGRGHWRYGSRVGLCSPGMLCILPSWDAVWSTIHNVVSRVGGGRENQAYPAWLHNMARWGQIAIYTSTGVLALYAGYALWVWRKYVRDWLPAVREERLQGGCVLEVLIPTGSKADARAAADMFGQLWNFLSDMARAGSAFGSNSQRTGPVGIGKSGKAEAERLALSFEMGTLIPTGKLGSTSGARR